MTYFIGVDIGGTFTDCVAVDGDGRVFTAKTASTHSTTPVEGVVTGLGLLAEAAGTSLEDLLSQAEHIGHGTTIGTNLVVERKGARVGLLTTRGHRDAIAMMRGGGRTAGVSPEALFNVHKLRKPAPLVARGDIVEVDERVAVDGAVLAPMTDEAARAAVTQLLERGVEAVSIALIWSIVHPEHEHRLRDLVKELAPNMYVSCSSDVSPRQGEYERIVATVVNSYVGPASSRYLDQLTDALQSRGLRSAPLIMQSSGGVVPANEASHLPLRTVGSGPSGGLAGAGSLARALGYPNVIATDMGGTSFEVGLLVDGQPTVASEAVLENHSFYLPHLDVRSIACGGGSIAHLDTQSGGLRVGPESAGAHPGPACYARGATEPTVTDADVVLGLLDPEYFLGGRMPLDRGAAEAAVGRVADALGLTLQEAAAGIIHINNFSAATLIRQQTLEEGLDPRDFVIFAYGGAGPVHAFGFGQELGVDEVVVPLGNGASTLSAYGIAASEIVRRFERQCSLTAPFNADALSEMFSAMEQEAVAAAERSGVDVTKLNLERTVLLRYAEQYQQELPLPIPAGPITPDVCADIVARFNAQYAQLYSEAAVAVFQTIEMFGIQVSARTASGAVEQQLEAARRAPKLEPVRTREVYWPGFETHAIPTEVYHEAPIGDQVIRGPALLELTHTTVSVAPGQELRATHNESLVLALGVGDAGHQKQPQPEVAHVGH